MMLRDNFPILNTDVNDHPLIYLDNAATMQMPKPVQERMQSFYMTSNANIHRGIHTLSERATESYESARETVREFIGADCADEIIFTSGTTASVNTAARMLEPFLNAGDEILVTEMEHHSNLLPWMELCRRKGTILQITHVKPDGTLDYEEFTRLLNRRTRVCAFTELSNVTGIRNPVGRMIAEIREKTDAWILVDGAQGAVHGRQSMQVLQPDFYCFSGHKLGAPTGTGVLYMRKCGKNSCLRPAFFGGGTVNTVDFDRVQYVEGPSLFEPGTPNYAGVIGLKSALEFWMEEEKNTAVRAEQLMSGMAGFNFNMQELLDEADGFEKKEERLLRDLEEELGTIDGVEILAKGQKHIGCLSFAVRGISAFDLCRLLDTCGVAVRSGHMCAEPYLRALGYRRVVRVSLAPYNTRKEIEDFTEYLRQIISEISTLQQYRAGEKRPENESMAETEARIIRELEANKTQAEQFAWITSKASNCMTPPENYRAHVYKMLDCQANTVVIKGWDHGHFVLFADSDALVMKGILALAEEIFMDRTEEELAQYQCGLAENGTLLSQISPDQKKSLVNILRELQE